MSPGGQNHVLLRSTDLDNPEKYKKESKSHQFETLSPWNTEENLEDQEWSLKPQTNNWHKSLIDNNDVIISSMEQDYMRHFNSLL